MGGHKTEAQTGQQAGAQKNHQSGAQKPSQTAEKQYPEQKGDALRMAASDLQEMNIDTAKNDTVGEIDEILINPATGKVQAVVVSTGGFLGMGERQTLLSTEDLRLNEDRTLMQLDLSKEQIKEAPQYIEGEMSDLENVRPLGRTAKAYQDREERTTQLKGDKTQNRGMKVSEFQEMSVENRQGETVGVVDEVFLNLKKSEVVGVVVSTGGFLGMGDRKTLLGIQEMTVDWDNEKIILDYSRDQIKELSEYKENDQAVFDGLNTRVSGLAPRSQGEQSSMDARTGARKVSPTLEGTSDMTVFDQGNSSEEIDMTASIRTAIGDNDKLSHKANNVTIITNKGKVVLRGEVDRLESRSPPTNDRGRSIPTKLPRQFK